MESYLRKITLRAAQAFGHFNRFNLFSMQREALLANAVMTITQLAKECDELSRIT